METLAQEEVWVALAKAGVPWGEMTPYVKAAMSICSSVDVLESSLTPVAEYVAHVVAATGCSPEMVPSIFVASKRLVEEIA